MDKHVVVRVGEEYPSTINNTTIGEEITMTYTVASGSGVGA